MLMLMLAMIPVHVVMHMVNIAMIMAMRTPHPISAAGGGVGAGTHDTERRLTGKIQAMMSDPKLRGRVVWLLMTARIHMLSPDIRRPGRVGDLIIPILDPAEDLVRRGRGEDVPRR